MFVVVDVEPFLVFAGKWDIMGGYGGLAAGGVRDDTGTEEAARVKEWERGAD